MYAIRSYYARGGNKGVHTPTALEIVPTVIDARNGVADGIRDAGCFPPALHVPFVRMNKLALSSLSYNFV